jgi:hypothetical protein
MIYPQAASILAKNDEEIRKIQAENERINNYQFGGSTAISDSVTKPIAQTYNRIGDSVDLTNLQEKIDDLLKNKLVTIDFKDESADDIQKQAKELTSRGYKVKTTDSQYQIEVPQVNLRDFAVNAPTAKTKVGDKDISILDVYDPNKHDILKKSNPELEKERWANIKFDNNDKLDYIVSNNSIKQAVKDANGVESVEELPLTQIAPVQLGVMNLDDIAVSSRDEAKAFVNRFKNKTVFAIPNIQLDEKNKMTILDGGLPEYSLGNALLAENKDEAMKQLFSGYKDADGNGIDLGNLRRGRSWDSNYNDKVSGERKVGINTLARLQDADLQDKIERSKSLFDVRPFTDFGETFTKGAQNEDNQNVAGFFKTVLDSFSSLVGLDSATSKAYMGAASQGVASTSGLAEGTAVLGNVVSSAIKGTQQFASQRIKSLGASGDKALLGTNAEKANLVLDIASTPVLGAVQTVVGIANVFNPVSGLSIMIFAKLSATS